MSGREGETDLTGRRVAVLGLARTGVATVKALNRLGAQPVVYDRKPPELLAERLSELAGCPADYRLGDEAYPGVDEADLVVVSPGFRADAPVLEAVRSRGVPLWPEIELAYRIARAPIVAVTGTNGKTTTAAWTANMLRAAGRSASVGGNMAPGTPLIELALDAGPEDILVAEVSSFQLETIGGFRPRVAVLTNLTPDHLDRHPSYEEYARAKRRVFEYQGPEDWAVVNADCPAALALSEGCRARRLLFSLKRPVEAGAWVEEGSLRLRIGPTEEDLGPASQVGLRGDHNLENGLAAALAARVLGAPPSALRRSLAAFPGVPHRMEPVDEVDGVAYINNSMCTNPEAWARSIESVPGPVILITGGRNKGLDFAAVGRRVAPRVRTALLIGQDAEVMEQALRGGGLGSVTRCETLEEAVDLASGIARPGDTVLLAPGCASMDMFRDFMERGDRFRAAVAGVRLRASRRG